jgi:hypothetical protein
MTEQQEREASEFKKGALFGFIPGVLVGMFLLSLMVL